MADGSRSRSETERLSQSSQERVRNRFPGHSRTLSEQDPQEERTEQELQQNENSEAENTDETNENFNINENDFCAIDSTDVGIHDAYNEEGGGGVDVHQPRRGRNHNICGNTFYANKGERVGISKVGNKYNNKSSVPFLLGLLALFVIASSFFFYISMVSKQNKK
ncbi:hypothetical protein PRUPE_1G184400 [Prunus persica]|uniref:Transmembrane protein n=1 Tax=Prunus persica TaxID=3760 RepID=A0A251QZK7_PRUPE|nr:uncharacterized protein LOC109946506 [Prunus persica]ONI29163.1 hypothetical protein PRUPE_1G184400 [Prunus persica]